MLKRLRIKFICINMLIVTAMLCVIFGMVFHFTRQNLEAESLRMMQALAAEPLRRRRPDSRLGEVRLPYFVLELGQRGELIAADGGYYDLSDENDLREILEAALETREPAATLAEYSLRFQRAATPMGQRIIFVDMSGEQNTLRNLARSCALVGAASLFAFFLISLFLARWAVRPVERAWTEQRQFVADASHELKTPLTVILTNAELMRGQGGDERERARSSESILSMAHQMRGLVESLLELARVDSGAVNAALSPLDLSELVSDALLPFEPLYFEHDLEIRSAVEQNIRVNGSGDQLRQVAEILLDNAMKYSSAPAVVSVALKRRGRRCLLSVSNPGAPIPPEELKKIFRRFYRMDQARSMNRSYGLGLSIAERIVKKHRGRIWAESRDGSNTFYVELPVAMPQQRPPDPGGH